MNRKVHNFIQFSEINENFIIEEDNELPVPTEEAPAEDSAPDGDLTSAEPTEEDELTPSGEGIPEILKVYTDSPEDLEELEAAGISLEGEPEENENPEEEAGETEPTGEGDAEGLEGDEEIGEDVLYIKVKTVEGDDIILKFTEEDPENRIPVEGEEDTFDTELVAQHNDHEYRITAEIKVNPSTGEEEELDVEPEAQIEEQPAGEGEDEQTEPSEEPTDEDEPSVVPENRIMNFTQFLNEAKKTSADEKDKKKKKEDKAGKAKDAKKAFFDKKKKK